MFYLLPWLPEQARTDFLMEQMPGHNRGTYNYVALFPFRLLKPKMTLPFPWSILTVINSKDLLIIINESGEFS